MKTITGKPIKRHDELRFVGSKQRYTVAVQNGQFVLLARYIEIHDGSTLIHADECDPQNRPERLMGEA
jgi:hypothetical protein